MENKTAEHKNFMEKIKITEVRQISIITFWITLILFISGSLIVLIDYFK